MILFICKKNDKNKDGYTFSKHSGLYNSTRFIAEALASQGLETKLVEVVDNNDIDREVTFAKADKVVIEALWVVPEKFDALKKLHPKVKWFVHLHSNIPFLAVEGIALNWLHEYVDRGLKIIANSDNAYDALKRILGRENVLHLNNIYDLAPDRVKYHPLEPDDDVIDIGCFGALRPMKNQLIQAMAAIEFARQHGVFLNFYVNSTRVETNGDPVLKNLRALFSQTPNTELVEVGWFPHEDFKLFLSTMDISMQVSLSETFNVVTADAVRVKVPVVTSSEIGWVNRACWAETSSVTSIVEAMHRVFDEPATLVKQNQWLLKNFSEKSLAAWVKAFK